MLHLLSVVFALSVLKGTLQAGLVDSVSISHLSKVNYCQEKTLSVYKDSVFKDG